MSVRKLLLGAAIAAGAITATMSSASAYVVCNRDGDCWHTDTRFRAPDPALRFTYHNDDWYFHRRWDNDRDYRYRDYHEGRGYYRNGLWVQF